MAVKASKGTDEVYHAGGAVYYPAGSRDGAALVVEKQVPEEVSVNAPFEYRIKVTNVSSSPLEDVTVKETLDEGFSMDNSTPKGNPGAGRTMAFTLDNIQPGQSKTITISGKASKPGTITSCATLDYRIPSCASIKVSAPGLAVTKTMTTDATVCDTITGKITVSNPGTGVTRNVKIQDNLPEGLKTTDGKSAIAIDVGQLRAGESKDYAFSLKADKTGKFTNMASATADGLAKVDSQPVSVTVRQPALSLKIECPAGPMMIGRKGTYKFTVKNTGDAPAAHSILNVSIPNSMKFVSADNSGGVSGTTLVYNLGTLAPNETRTLSAVYQNTGPGIITARAQLIADCAQEVRDNCETTVQGVADIGTMLTDDIGVTTVGDDQVYRCEVKNQGQLDLTNVTVVATWPGELDWVRSDMAGSAAVGTKAEFKLGTVKVGEIRKFTFTLKAKVAGEYKINTVTTAKEIKNPLSQDEVTTYIDR
ncbi:MAG: hypothetical protein U0802_11940 [Candidatus Binatia bacterium]